jgi:ornithine carbamoyltransferase
MNFNNYKPIGKIPQKHMLSLNDYSREDIYEILKLAIKLKKERAEGIKHDIMKDKTLALIFTMNSTRTRLSFEMGMRQLGGDTLFLSAADIQLSRGESIYDTAMVLNRMGLSGVMIRTFEQQHVDDLAKFGTYPVINGLTDSWHPCQVLADIMTVYENFGTLDGLKLTFSGEGNNMSHSLMVICAKLGIEYAVAGPKEYAPKPEIVDYARNIGGKVLITDDIEAAMKGSDVIYSDVFFSMGQKDDPNKKGALMPFQVNSRALSMTGKDSTIFLHCLPAHRGEEVTAEIIDGPHSRVFDEAENRLHSQKAILALLLNKN